MNKNNRKHAPSMVSNKPAGAAPGGYCPDYPHEVLPR